MYCMGIDHHKQYSFITVLNEGGDIVKTGKVNNMSLDLERFLVGMGEMRAVVEAGRSSYTMIDLLEGLGVDVVMAHPKDVKAIAKAKIKTDKRDSHMLAHLLRKGRVLGKVKEPGPEITVCADLRDQGHG